MKPKPPILKNFLTYRLTPERLIFWSFAAAIIIGAFLLKLPVSTYHGIKWIDAFFMSASAICVTGLGVIDVGKDLTFTGQIILLVLIQIGGLGIMTFSVFFALLLRMRTSVTSRLSLGSMSRTVDTPNLLRSLVLVLIGTFFIEGVGAVLLYCRFMDMFPAPEAIFYSVFHAISAFCNCGFSLFPDSLERFRTEYFLPLVMMGLIILGGIGFVVLVEIHDWFWSIIRRQPFRISFHAQIAILGSLILILIGADVLWFLERDNSLAAMPLGQQIINACFFSVTPRTAGFNLIPTLTLGNASLFFMIFLMFIGGCPGSTAGGIKITTFVTLLALIRGKLRLQPMAYVLKRKIPDEVVDKALAIFATAFIVLCCATLFLQMTEDVASYGQIAGRGFLDLLFEATSALGTVGLSTGVTPQLSLGGKAIIIFLMFFGRIGPITLGIALLPKSKSRTQFEYPEENIVIG